MQFRFATSFVIEGVVVVIVVIVVVVIVVLVVHTS